MSVVSYLKLFYQLYIKNCMLTVGNFSTDVFGNVDIKWKENANFSWLAFLINKSVGEA